MADKDTQQEKQSEKVPVYEVPAIPSHSEIVASYEDSKYDDRIEIAKAAMERALKEYGIDYLYPSEVKLSPDRVHKLPKKGFEGTRKKLGRPQIFTTKPKRKSGFHLTVARLNNSENPEDNTIVFFKSGRVKNSISLNSPGTWGVMSEKEYNEYVTDKRTRKSLHGKFLRGKVDSLKYARRLSRQYKDMFGMSYKEYVNTMYSPESQEEVSKVVERLRGEYTETLQTKSQETTQAMEEAEDELEKLNESKTRLDLAIGFYETLKEADKKGFLTPELADWLKPEGLDEEVARSISEPILGKQEKKAKPKASKSSPAPPTPDQQEPPDAAKRNTKEGKGAFAQTIRPLVESGELNKETFLELAQQHSLDNNVAAEIAEEMYKSAREEDQESAPSEDQLTEGQKRKISGFISVAGKAINKEGKIDEQMAQELAERFKLTSDELKVAIERLKNEG